MRRWTTCRSGRSTRSRTGEVTPGGAQPPGGRWYTTPEGRTPSGVVVSGGAERKTLYLTDSLNGDILTAHVPVAGKLLFGLQ